MPAESHFASPNPIILLKKSAAEGQSSRQWGQVSVHAGWRGRKDATMEAEASREKHLESQTTPSPALQPSSFLMFLR